MVKQQLEGLSILPSPPSYNGAHREPVVCLDAGLTLDDRVFEAPMLLLGATGSGKSVLLERIMEPVLRYAAEVGDNVVIFCAKSDLLKFRRSHDPSIAVDSTNDPSSCWNLFLDLAASNNPELTARDIARSLTLTQHSQLTPFFENAANDILFHTIMCMFEEQQSRGKPCSNWHLADFLNRTSLKKLGEDPTWYELAKLRPWHFAHILDYFGDDLGQGYGVISELRTLMHECFWGSFCSDNGTFSAIDALRSGGKRIFLHYNYASASEASVKIIQTILNLLLKHSLDEDNMRHTWFFLDEFQLLPQSIIADVMSLGRGLGTRVICCTQSAQMLTRHYSEQEAKTLLSLFPNVICMQIQDGLSRSVLADRYGESLCSYSFSSPMQKSNQHIEHRPVVADYDFALIQRKGDAICSMPSLSTSPFLYHGYRKELEQK